MGNAALEIFADITQDGNRWKETLKLPAPTEVLGGDQFAWDGSSASKRGPRLLVAPIASSVRLDGQQASCTNYADEYGPLQMEHEYQPNTQCGRRLSADGTSLLTVRPTQVVLQPGAAVRGRLGLRPESLFSWRPLDSCHALSKRGSLLTEARLLELRPHLPVVTRFSSCWKLIYCPAIHGVSLQTFYRQCNSWPGETLLLVEDTNGFVFGCFATQTWRASSQRLHYGSVECFVFSFGEAGESKPLEFFPWAGGNQYFMHADSSGFSMGGGKNVSLYVRNDFLTGHSGPSETFGTKAPLSSQEEFVIRQLECWTFDHSEVSNVTDPWTGLATGRHFPPGQSSDSDHSEESLTSGATMLRASARDMQRYRFD